MSKIIGYFNSNESDYLAMDGNGNLRDISIGSEIYEGEVIIDSDGNEHLELMTPVVSTVNMGDAVIAPTSLILRGDKGSELTHDELDANFNELKGKIDGVNKINIVEMTAKRIFTILKMTNEAPIGVDITQPIAILRVNGTIEQLPTNEDNAILVNPVNNGLIDSGLSQVSGTVAIYHDGYSFQSQGDIFDGLTQYTSDPSLLAYSAGLFDVDSGLSVYDLDIMLIPLIDLDAVGIVADIKLV